MWGGGYKSGIITSTNRGEVGKRLYLGWFIVSCRRADAL